jgi:serine/threonine protein kinase
MLRCLVLLEKRQMVHSDIKPDNVMIQHDDNIKIIDFGLCQAEEDTERPVPNLLFRAPEAILGAPVGHALDIWSLACTASYLILGRPLFPECSERMQMALYMEALGLPPAYLVAHGQRSSKFFDGTMTPLHITDDCCVDHLPGTRPISSLLADCDPGLVAFLTACLRMDPRHRLRASQVCFLKDATLTLNVALALNPNANSNANLNPHFHSISNLSL